MPSKIISAASALLAFSGMALANYNSTNGYNSTGSAAPSGMGSAKPSGSSNMTAPANMTTPANSTGLTGEAAFCAEFSFKLFGFEGFLVECGRASRGGVEIDVIVDLAKRQTFTGGLSECIDTCRTLEGCTATQYDNAANTCTFFEEAGALEASNTIDFAFVAIEDTTAPTVPVTVVGGVTYPLETSTVFVTSVGTVYSCASTVTDCPYNQLTTVTIDSYTTVCPGNTPVTATGAVVGPVSGVVTQTGAPVACTGCPYSSATIVDYTSTVNGAGVTSYIAVSTVVANVPSLTAVAATTAFTTTIMSTPTATASHFTGAAGHVEAGGMVAAMIGAAALLI